MKCFRRYLCVFFSFLLLSIAFSIPVNAESLEQGSYYFTVSIWNTDYSIFDTQVVYPQNGEQEYYTDVYHDMPKNSNGEFKLVHRWILEKTDQSILIEKGNTTSVVVEDAYLSILRTVPNMEYFREPTAITAKVVYDNGTPEWYDVTEYANDTGKAYVSFSFVPKRNVKQIIYQFESIIPPNGSETTMNFNCYLGENGGDGGWRVSITQQSEEAGLLSGIKGLIDTIIGWLKSLADGITNVVNSIKELPSKIWALIEEGLKGLFIPTENDLDSYKNNLDELLEERLGAVYEVVNLTFESWDRINASDVTDTVELPLVTIPLPGDEEFTFGGYDVKIVPDGFGVLTAACKLITAMLATVAFINGLRKRYDEVMGVEQ